MSTSTPTTTSFLSKDNLITLMDRTAHALEQTARLERLLSKLGRPTSKSMRGGADVTKSLALAERALGFTRAALEDMASVLPKTAAKSKNADQVHRLAS